MLQLGYSYWLLLEFTYPFPAMSISTVKTIERIFHYKYFFLFQNFLIVLFSPEIFLPFIDYFHVSLFLYPNYNDCLKSLSINSISGPCVDQFPLTVSFCLCNTVSCFYGGLFVVYCMPDTVYQWIIKTEVENIYLPWEKKCCLCQADKVTADLSD